jgi:hypothetical protein
MKMRVHNVSLHSVLRVCHYNNANPDRFPCWSNAYHARASKACTFQAIDYIGHLKKMRSTGNNYIWKHSTAESSNLWGCDCATLNAWKHPNPNILCWILQNMSTSLQPTIRSEQGDKQIMYMVSSWIHYMVGLGFPSTCESSNLGGCDCTALNTCTSQHWKRLCQFDCIWGQMSTHRSCNIWLQADCHPRSSWFHHMLGVGFPSTIRGKICHMKLLQQYKGVWSIQQSRQLSTK